MLGKIVSGLAQLMGTNEAGACLTITLFAGYPLSVIYRKCLIKRPAYVQHLFFTLTGGALIFFSYGLDLWHSMFSVFIAYLLCRFLADSVISVIISFVFHMSHLLLGYYATESDIYDITWTMPQCILTLRLIGGHP